jgi:hypothetical protein
MRQRVLLALVFAFIWTAATPTLTAQATRKDGRPKSRLNWVELDGKYKIQVPEDFTLGRISDKMTAVPAFYFNAKPPDHTSIQVFLLPMTGVYQTDPKTGRPQIEMDGAALSRYFEISGGMVVYYGWNVDDNAYECTMNTPCPVPVPRKLRYGTLYVFAAFDNTHRTIVEFRGDHLGATQNVTNLEGDGKLLRNVIVPSLSSISKDN